MGIGLMRWWAGLADLVLPGGCAGCGKTGPAWCARCAASVGPPRRARPVATGLPVVAVGAYSGPLRAALLAYKERGRRELVDPLAGLLVAALRAGPAGWLGGEVPVLARRCWLVPAPSRPGAARVRGGPHLAPLVERVADRLAGPCAAAGGSLGVSDAVRMRRGGRDSVGLDAAARAENLRGRLMVRPDRLPPRGALVLLVDDVVTTGVTLRGCARALRAAGVEVGGGLVLCDATGGTESKEPKECTHFRAAPARRVEQPTHPH